MTQPLLVVLYGGPGTGKSTTAAQVFAILKTAGVSVEFVHEFAKDLTWERRHVALGHQPYIAGEQMLRYDRLRGQCDVIVTDTSTLLGSIYGSEANGVTPAFVDWLVDDYSRRRTLNFFLRRDPGRPYNPSGRRQSEESAKAADRTIQVMLDAWAVPYHEIQLGPDSHAAYRIARLAQDAL